MYSFNLTDEMLTGGERTVFAGFLEREGVDAAIWDVFDCFLRVSSKRTRPQVLRAYSDGRLAGAAFVARCCGFGRSLFSHPLLYAPVDAVGLPSFIWIRAGFCAEILANPGFAAEGFNLDELIPPMLGYLRKRSLGVMVTDMRKNERVHAEGHGFPYVSDGVVDVAGMTGVDDYIAQHGNLVRKLKHYRNKGGGIDVIHGPLSEDLRRAVEHCIESTVCRSIITSPFQDTFADAAAETCTRPSAKVVHFVGHMGGAVLGYHTFVRTGRGLRMMHGAFDRERKTTRHCYENLIVRIAQYAIEEGLEKVHFGPILNETKRRMMNVSTPCSLYFYSRFGFMRAFFPAIFRLSNMQRRELLAFAE